MGFCQSKCASIRNVAVPQKMETKEEALERTRARLETFSEERREMIRQEYRNIFGDDDEKVMAFDNSEEPTVIYDLVPMDDDYAVHDTNPTTEFKQMRLV